MNKQTEIYSCNGVFVHSEKQGIHSGDALVWCQVRGTHVRLRGPFTRQTEKVKPSGGRQIRVFKSWVWEGGVDLKGHVGIWGVMEMFCVCVCVCVYIYIYIFFFLLLLHCTPCEILVSWPEIEAVPLHWKDRVLTTVPPEKPLKLFCL